MDKMKVRDLMTPVEKFPRISESTLFYEALAALESAQDNFSSGKFEQRIVLVENAKGKVISKISPIDLIRGLEANYSRIDVGETLKRFGLRYIWESMQKDFQLWQNPFKDLCRKAAEVKVKDFIKPPPEGQIVGPDDPLDKCFHLFVMNRHDTLFVMERNEIIALLRFSDVFKMVGQKMKECAIS